MQKALFVGCLLAAICGAAAGAFKLGISSAKAADTGPKWDYFCFAAYDAKEVALKASAAGARGWEMVAVSGNSVWCFKRPKSGG